jgi:hypothetical protein
MQSRRNVDPAFGCLHGVKVGCVANVSKEYSARTQKQDQH